MDRQPAIPIAEPKIVEVLAMIFAGLKTHYAHDAIAGIPQQWQRFNAIEGDVPGRTGDASYGICMSGDSTGFDYITGVEVKPSATIDGEFTRIALAPATYAVFSHGGHITEMRATFDAIWNGWFPKSGRSFSGAPLFERYGPAFNAETGAGGFEIWIPLKP